MKARAAWFLLCIAPLLPAQSTRTSTQAPTLTPRELRRDGDGVLWQVGEQRVLLLKGTPREMGRQHGVLLRDEVRLVTEEVLTWTAGMGCDEACLQKILAAHQPFVPAFCDEELTGLAEGSGVAVDRLRLVHAMPERFHCSGVAVRGPRTRDGQLYHTRSLDYALNIGVTSRLQNHALLIVREPKDGIPSVVPAWAGFLGAVTGMSAAGIAVGEMGSNSKDERYDGVPMIFLVRAALLHARTLAEAVAVFERGPRTCGFHFVVSSGSEKDAVALELSRSHFARFGMGDARENVAPHFALSDAVRRVNHFVDPILAATQRTPYDPRQSAATSFDAYRKISEFLEEQAGHLDGPLLVELLRRYPAAHGCLHQAVMAPGLLRLWVSQAGDDRVLPFPGAQNRDFHEYSLTALLARRPEPVAVLRPRAGEVLPALPREQTLSAVPLAPGTPEPWRALAGRGLAGGVLHTEAVQAVAGGIVRIRMQPAAGASIEFLLHRPAPRKGGRREPGVVVFGTGEPSGLIERSLAEALVKLGVATAAVRVLPAPGNGQAPDAALRLDPALRDAVAAGLVALRVLRTLPEVDPERVTVLGPALGAAPALLTARLDPAAARLCVAFAPGSYGPLLAEGATLSRILGLRGAAREAVAAECEPFAPATLAQDLSERPILCVGIQDDRTLTRALQQSLVDALPDAEVAWFPGRLSRIQDQAPGLVLRIHGFLNR